MRLSLTAKVRRSILAILVLAALLGGGFALHPVQAASSDPVLRSSSFAPATGTFTVPGRTGAVFVSRRPAAERIGLLVGDVDALAASGTITKPQAESLRAKLAAAVAALPPRGSNAAAIALLRAFNIELKHLVNSGALTLEGNHEFGGAVNINGGNVFVSGIKRAGLASPLGSGSNVNLVSRKGRKDQEKRRQEKS